MLISKLPKPFLPPPHLRSPHPLNPRRLHHHLLLPPMADSSRSSPTAAADDLLAQPPPATDSGSLPAEGAGAAEVADGEYGFQRTEFGKEKLVGTVQFHERHVFLCYKGPQVWPSHVEAAESDRLPRLLSAAIAARKADMKKRTKLTICEGEDGTESSNGDVLIFPDMIRYRRLTHFDVDTFVEEVLVKDTEWLPGSAETITGSYVFVCCHGSRDKRCGVCGPSLIKRFKEEISALGLDGQVAVSACSHVGGHKYAGNVIIFSPDIKGEVTGHWYGYVAPDDVPVLLDHHIGKGEIVDHLWRGQMGLAEEQQKKALELRHMMNGVTEKSLSAKEFPEETGTDGAACNPGTASGCCQGDGAVTCCQNGPLKEKQEKSVTDEQNPKSSEKENEKDNTASSKKGNKKSCPMPTWFETWEREDTYAALAVVAAAASVFVAYSFYKQLK